jgi:hypothetical protein
MAISGDLKGLALPAGVEGLAGLAFLKRFQRWGAEEYEDGWVFSLELK